MGLEVLLIPFIIVGLGYLVGSPRDINTKDATFCTTYVMKDGGSELVNCYDVREVK